MRLQWSPWSSSPQTQWRSRLWPCCGHRQNDSPWTGMERSCSAYDRSSEPCSCLVLWAPTPRLPRLRSPPGLRTLRVATLDRSGLPADDDDGPGTGSSSAPRTGDPVELALCRLADASDPGKVSPSVGSLKRRAGDGRPPTAVVCRTASSLPFAMSPIRPSPADDRGSSPASLRDRLVGIKRPRSLAIDLPNLR